MADILAGLNEQQIEAVTSTEGFVRVIAGAGSGKTRALTRRFAYLVSEVGIRPSSILCVTFTNKAASEMRQRIHQLTGDNDTAFVCTFHSFCVSVLQEDSRAVRYPKQFLVLDNSDIDDMLGMIYEERHLSLRDSTYADARDMFEMRKIFTEPDYYQDLISLSAEQLREKYLAASDVRDILFYGYLYQQKKCYGLDYNDLIKFTLYIFAQNPDIRLKWQKRLEYIMIDEFQDIDQLQYDLMEVLCAYHRNLFIVGDPDQTIYTWRGASVRFLQDFDKSHPGTRTIFMMKNYRSTPEILQAANSLIEKNANRIRKDLIPVLPHGQKVTCSHCRDSHEEARWILSEIHKLHEAGVPYSDITLLYRAHYVTRPLEEEFIRAKVPYTLYSGTPFFSRAEIKDALSYLRMAAFRDDLSFLRIVNVPKRSIGRSRIQILQEYSASHSCTLYEALEQNADTEAFRPTKAREFIRLIEKYAGQAEHMRASEMLTKMLEESGYEALRRTEGDQARLDNLAELKQSVYEYEATCGEETDVIHYLRRIALFTSLDASSPKDEVKLMTVHTAKGLEFPYVFLCAMSEGIFPSKKTRLLTQMEEERRLAFVAMTRAEKGLYLSDSEGRNFDHSARFPSRFLLDIDPAQIRFVTPLPDSLVAKARTYYLFVDKNLLPDRASLPFQEGDRVVHAVFGEGTVQSIDFDEEVIFVNFDKLGSTRGIALRAADKLSVVRDDPSPLSS